MAESSRLDAAASRLSQALAALETAVLRRLEGDRSHVALIQQLEAAQADRARLAEEVDLSAERIAELEAVNRDVARRIDQTMDAIRGVLKAQDA